MEVDRVPLSQLPSRYGIARSALYTRLKDLKIEPSKEGKKAYVSAEQLQLLDELHDHINKGGTTGEFLKQREESYHPSPLVENNLALSADRQAEMTVTGTSALVAVVEAIVKRLIPSSGSRLSYLRELEEAYERGWLLSTSEVADLLGLSPKTVTSYGRQFEDAGFVFTRAGTRKRGEIAWAIEKHSELDSQPSQSDISIKQAFSSEFDPETE